MRLLPGRVSAAVSEAGLPPASLPDFMTYFFRPSTGSVASVEGVTPEIIEIASRASSQTYLDSFKLVWYTSIAFGVLTLLAAVFTNDVSPHLSSGASGGAFVRFPQPAPSLPFIAKGPVWFIFQFYQGSCKARKNQGHVLTMRFTTIIAIGQIRQHNCAEIRE